MHHKPLHLQVSLGLAMVYFCSFKLPFSTEMNNGKKGELTMYSVTILKTEINQSGVGNAFNYEVG